VQPRVPWPKQGAVVANGDEPLKLSAMPSRISS
jgi:hypothetical protein